MPAFAGMTNYDTVSQGGGNSFLYFNAFTLSPGGRGYGEGASSQFLHTFPPNGVGLLNLLTISLWTGCLPRLEQGPSSPFKKFLRVQESIEPNRGGNHSGPAGLMAGA